MKVRRLAKKISRNGKKRNGSRKNFSELRAEILPLLEPYGVEWIALFGSVVRGEQKRESDIDILVDFEEPRRKPLGLFKWVELEEELEKRLGRKVDLVSNAGLSKYIRPYVEKEMVIIYDKG
ncbi:MAG: nucleotidyltransferase family protein [Chloroflexi bacterium]|nr:nucleotidyltransferase family protein [Chloroflexota bacterium]MBI3741488.1 nucleotidyltransferase family protein [Chloroflexota bacterium]